MAYGLEIDVDEMYHDHEQGLLLLIGLRGDLQLESKVSKVSTVRLHLLVSSSN
jgi:hypothetical protein